MQSLLLWRKLMPSISEHRKVECETLALLEALLQEKYIARSPRRLNPFGYAQKNIFSILFLALYRAVGIDEPRRRLYGLINHAVRGLVTGTDNLLDDEYKEMLPLRFPAGATRFKSVMHILLFDRILFRSLDRALEQGLISGTERERVSRAVFQAMVPIGEEEATEEGGVSEIFTPERILSSVHMYKGGNLLRLAFVAPLLLEPEMKSLLEPADRGIYQIGVALQIIDDLTDFYEDIRDRRHNYLVSSIHHEGTKAERELLASLLTRRGDTGEQVHLVYRESVYRVMDRAIGRALSGFALLEQAGFRIRQKDAMRLMCHLFKLRGVGHLLELLPGQQPVFHGIEARV